MNETLYQQCAAARIAVNHVCEVGVWRPEASNVLGFIRDGIRTTLVEADPDIVSILKSTFADSPNVSIVPNAIYHTECNLEFCRAESSTFAKDLSSSPALKNDRFQTDKAQTFTVQAVRFDKVDDHTIDVLSIDVEGCDWFVLQYLVSRPILISIETGIKRYVNPYMKEIRAWMHDNGYYLWYHEKSDSVYARIDAVPPSFFARLRLRFRP